jgi:hypothetical protein
MGFDYRVAYRKAKEDLAAKDARIEKLEVVLKHIEVESRDGTRRGFAGLINRWAQDALAESKGQAADQEGK